MPARDRVGPEGERVVVEGVTAERQAPLIPRIPMERRLCWISSRLCRTASNPSLSAKTLSADPCVSWCECIALIRHLLKLQEACDAKANHRDRGEMNAMDVGVAEAQKCWSHLAWMTTARDQVAVVETDNVADLAVAGRNDDREPRASPV